jgi:hypothetical protein
VLAADAEAFLSSLSELVPSELSEKAALGSITALERVKRAAEAAQAR